MLTLLGSLYSQGCVLEAYCTEDELDQLPYLHHAAKVGDIESVKLLVELGIEDVNARAHFGWSSPTPLHYAATYGHFEIVKYLVENGADVNANYLHLTKRPLNAP